MGEHWVSVDGAPKYEVSALGRIRNTESGYIFRTRPNKRSGYHSTVLRLDSGEPTLMSPRRRMTSPQDKTRIIAKTTSIAAAIWVPGWMTW